MAITHQDGIHMNSQPTEYTDHDQRRVFVDMSNVVTARPSQACTMERINFKCCSKQKV